MSWIFLMLPVIGLIVGCWPIGAWHQWSWFWTGVLILTLIFEGVSKWASPDKETISNVMRDYRKKGVWELVRFWVVGTFWMLFAWMLWVHVAT